MRSNQAALGRHAQVVRILSQLPLFVQDKCARVGRSKKHTQRIFLPIATIIIRYSESGGLSIEIRPP